MEKINVRKKEKVNVRKKKRLSKENWKGKGLNAKVGKRGKGERK